MVAIVNTIEKIYFTDLPPRCEHRSWGSHQPTPLEEVDGKLISAGDDRRRLDKVDESAWA